MKTNTMRKYFALSMVALMALTFAIAAVGCGKKAEETPAASTESSGMSGSMDSSSSAGMDTTMKSDTTMHK